MYFARYEDGSLRRSLDTTASQLRRNWLKNGIGKGWRQRLNETFI